MTLAVFTAGALVITGIYGVSQIRAAATPLNMPIIQKLSDTFNLDTADVQKVFDAQKSDRQAEMQKIQAERLDGAVKDGVITEAQKNTLIDKWQEMESLRQKQQDDLEKWFSEQGIDPAKLAPYGGFGHHGAGGMHGGYRK